MALVCKYGLIIECILANTKTIKNMDMESIVGKMDDSTGVIGIMESNMA